MIATFSDREMVRPLVGIYLIVVDTNLCPITSLVALGPARSNSLVTIEMRND